MGFGVTNAHDPVSKCFLLFFKKDALSSLSCEPSCRPLQQARRRRWPAEFRKRDLLVRRRKFRLFQPMIDPRANRWVELIMHRRHRGRMASADVGKVQGRPARCRGRSRARGVVRLDAKQRRHLS